MRLLLGALAGAAILASCASPTASSYPIYNPPTPEKTHSPTILKVNIDSPASAARLADSRPNIIVFLTDDQPYHTVDYMPAVKRQLIAGGIRFQNGFVTTPLCCPARVSFLTGEYVHNHTVYTDRMPMGGAGKFDASTSIAMPVHDAGYRTAYFGKYLNGYETLSPYGVVPPGWDSWKVFLDKNMNYNEDLGSLQYYFDFNLSENGTPVEYPKSKSGFSGDVITKDALAFIRDSRDVPFFLMLGYYNPHSPYIAAPRHQDAFRAATNWDWVPYRPPSFNEPDISGKPKYIAALSPLSPAEIDTVHLQILRSLLSVDDGVASVLTALKKAGLDQNTIVLYFSDNGLTLGDHRFGASKNCPYEACVKIPFIIYAPGYYEPRTDAHLVADIDIAPTIAEWAGAVIPHKVDGMSLVPLLKDPSSAWRDSILFEHWPTEQGVGSMIPRFSSIRTAEWKYTEYDTGEVELYDLVHDPDELHNLAGQADLKDIQATLALQLQGLKQH